MSSVACISSMFDLGPSSCLVFSLASRHLFFCFCHCLPLGYPSHFNHFLDILPDSLVLHRSSPSVLSNVSNCDYILRFSFCSIVRCRNRRARLVTAQNHNTIGITISITNMNRNFLPSINLPNLDCSRRWSLTQGFTSLNSPDRF